MKPLNIFGLIISWILFFMLGVFLHGKMTNTPTVPIKATSVQNTEIKKPESDWKEIGENLFRQYDLEYGVVCYKTGSYATLSCMKWQW